MSKRCLANLKNVTKCCTSKPVADTSGRTVFQFTKNNISTPTCPLEPGQSEKQTMPCPRARARESQHIHLVRQVSSRLSGGRQFRRVGIACQHHIVSAIAIQCIACNGLAFAQHSCGFQSPAMPRLRQSLWSVQYSGERRLALSNSNHFFPPFVLRPLIQVSQLHQISKSRKRSLSSPN